MKRVFAREREKFKSVTEKKSQKEAILSIGNNERGGERSGEYCRKERSKEQEKGNREKKGMGLNYLERGNGTERESKTHGMEVIIKSGLEIGRTRK